jgi:hypothetical protein
MRNLLAMATRLTSLSGLDLMKEAPERWFQVENWGV